MNCDWISRKCCPFWPFALKAKDDAKYQFDPNNHIKIEPKAEEKEEMKEISNDNHGMNINKGKERKNFFFGKSCPIQNILFNLYSIHLYSVIKSGDHWVWRSYFNMSVRYFKIEVTKYISSLLRIFKIACQTQQSHDFKTEYK